ncbi:MULTISPECIES: glucose 1-dehydrogenase [unclassified Halomonas]|uniref:SDR family NAD(P)-dependent oxidoreductase n=1 Tax=unclassified Halomonas TaxID=2609666 RepID=UPI000C8B7E2D|nr:MULTISPECIES: glucose 1-dehydrogenase [unclassified Halomonas]MBR9770514.1 glucose 1-dehydrogenase [Gammaproteobacteria bacterium]MAR71999.1 3-oxoacyl-ACP reductase [Halomonas sp.]MBR9878756.1 glucose 1-dehydrogenase [Gammaproteobacteria bacterium]MCJ8287292.1 glucose 1-dehydrogenase [Halomonas sp.]NQY72011.1 glucose 1-dehydrogenase [Halomonas sp.]
MSELSLPSTPSFRLEGKRALVTGASKGLGLACACALAQAGAAVTLVARQADELERVRAALSDAGYRVDCLALDVTDLDAVQRALATQAFDILVNNAGTNRPKPLDEISVDDYDSVMNLNVRAAYFLAQTVARRMPAGGSIINMSSQMGHVGAANRTLYCASKAAMEGMTKAMAVELGPVGIRANTLCPTFVETPMTRPFFERPGFRDEVLAKIPLGRLGQVEDIMGPLVFLASAASALVSGSALMVDGGWTAH